MLKGLRASILSVAVIGFFAGSTYAALTLGPGAPPSTDDSVNGVLSDFSQRYGQVVGQEVTFDSAGYISDVSVWGLYYNYHDLTFTAPTADDFTLRIHDIAGSDPDEAYLTEVSLGAGTRTDIGTTLYGLNIFRYDFTGLHIDVSALDLALVSIINETTNSDTDGYWHWVTAEANNYDDWWRREDLQPAGQEDTFYWTPGVDSGYPGSRALSLTYNPVPTPSAILLGLLGGAMIGLRRR